MHLSQTYRRRVTMLFTVDIGNTNILFGIFDGDSIVLQARLSTDSTRTYEQYALEIKGICDLNKVSLDKINGSIISSVVPDVTALLKNAVIFLTGVEPLLVGPGLKNGLKIKIDNPAQLGADFVACAVGAIEKYQYPCLIMDLGTATKISIIDDRGAFIGCIITAGVGISLGALSGSASLLPKINIDLENCPVYGTNTVTSMQAGIIHGTASMLDGMCDRIEAALGKKVSDVIVTGGLARNISNYCKRDVIYEPNLILFGLKAIYNKN